VTELKKSISFSVLVLLAINAIIGTGIFFVPGIAARIAGPASIISWILVAILALLVAACFAELVSMFPKAGGVYEYTKQAFGEFGGFMVGWISWIVANVTIAMLSIGCLEYLAVFIDMSHITKTILALLIVLFVNFVSFRGIDLSVKVLLVFSIITIMSLWTLMSWGIYYFDVSKLQFLDIFPKVSIVIAMVYILETFFGWETVANLAEETKDAANVIPKVMMISTIAVIILAIGVVSVALGAVPYEVLASSSAPLTDVAEVIMGSSGALIISALIFLNIFGGAAAWIITAPRLIFALARDGLLPSSLGKIHPKFQTPYMAIIVQAVLSGIIILSGSYELLLEMILPLAIFMYTMVVMSVSILRFTDPHRERKFRVPFGKVLPIIVGLTLMFLMGGIEIPSIMTGAMFAFIGIPLYLLKGIENKSSVLEGMLNWTSWFRRISYNVFVKPRTHKHILAFFGDFKDRKILNMGSSSGVLAKELAEIVGVNGTILATDVSEGDLKNAHKLAMKHRLNNIEFIREDSNDRSKLHHKIKNIHGATSIGLLGYTSDPDKLLDSLSERVVHRGRIYFIDYDRVFKLFRAPDWLRNRHDLIIRFKKHGFHVSYEIDKGWFWDTIHISGYKIK
jgi:APA family basic amino acid/polyamine antiporter/amino acid efflux transporter